MLKIGDFGAVFEGPSCESAIEEALEYRLGKYAAKRVLIERQRPALTPWGNFRLDFVLHVKGFRIGIECDGADFHDEVRDAWRDAVLLGEGCVDEVIRFAGQDLHHRPDDCLYILSVMHGDVFAARAHETLDRLASDAALGCSARTPDERIHFVAVEGLGDDDQAFAAHRVKIWRRRRLAPDQLWQHFYRFAVSYGPTSLDNLIACVAPDWKRSNPF